MCLSNEFFIHLNQFILLLIENSMFSLVIDNDTDFSIFLCLSREFVSTVFMYEHLNVYTVYSILYTVDRPCISYQNKYKPTQNGIGELKYKRICCSEKDFLVVLRLILSFRIFRIKLSNRMPNWYETLRKHFRHFKCVIFDTLFYWTNMWF